MAGKPPLFSLIVVVTLLTALSVSIAGLLGFVGLLSPHMARLLCPHLSHQFLILRSILMGAFFLLLSDVGVRYLFYPWEVPVGGLTAIIGSPFLIFCF